MKQKWLSILIGLWLLGGLAVLLGKMAENFLAGFRRGLGRGAANEQE